MKDTQYQNLIDRRLALQLFLPNPLKSGREWRCSWSSADRRCSNYIWVINNFIAYQGASYIRFDGTFKQALDDSYTLKSWTVQVGARCKS